MAAQSDAMRELVRAWNACVCAEMLPSELAARGGTVLRTGASEEHIRAAERRPGVKLPPSYREFLAISNGARATSVGSHPVADPEFLRVEEIGWAVLEAPSFVDRWIEPWEGNETIGVLSIPEGCWVDVQSYAPLEDALLISRTVESFDDFLVPVDGAEEWQLWSFTKEGAMAYRSFAEMLRSHIAYAQPCLSARRTIDEQLVELIRRAAHGDFGYVLDHIRVVLNWSEDPRLAQIGVQMLTDDRALTAYHEKLSGAPKPTVTEAALGADDRQRVMQACELLRLMPTPDTPEALKDAATARDALRAASYGTDDGIVRINVLFQLIRLAGSDCSINAPMGYPTPRPARRHRPPLENPTVFPAPAGRGVVRFEDARSGSDGRGGRDSPERASRDGVVQTAGGRTDPQYGHCAVRHDLSVEAFGVLLDLGLEPFRLALVGVERDERPFGDELAIGTVCTLWREDGTAGHA